jgi:ribosomal protein S12 methylthiotransferase
MKREGNKTARPLRVGIISLGCAKNLVDAEVMLGSLLKEGTQITNDPGEADALIVNTCSFIDSAQEESVDAIIESAAIREQRKPDQALIVSGCLPQRYREQLPKLLPEVDAFMGIDQVAHAGDIVQKAITLRAGKLAGAPSSRAESSAAKVQSRLAELNPQESGSLGQNETRSRRKSATTRPKTIVAPRSPIAQLPSPDTSLVEVNQRPRYIPDYATPRFRLTPKHFAYVKIAEGCNHPCSFCTIPRMRGSHRSRPQSDIVAEARQLIAAGVKELNLISQDSTYYGMDLRPNHSRAISSPERFNAVARSLPADATTLSTLLRELNALEGDFWIRLLYTHPAHWTDELIATIAACPKVARYVDMPLQHIHEVLLERMRRETSQQCIVDLIKRIRAGIAGIALRTTLIVGFPGETEYHFQTLLDFIHETKFERLGVFTYSKEEGTRASRMESQVADRVKKRRRDQVMAAQREVAMDVSASFEGRTIKVLVEGAATAKQLQRAKVSSWEHGLIRSGAGRQFQGPYLVARGEADAPDIDGRVYVRGKLPVGEFAEVKVVGHTDYDLIAEPA